MLLESQDDMVVLSEATNGSEAVRLSADLHPDIVLMDVRITAAGDRTHVLILTTFDLDEYAYAGLRASASGFLVKDAQPEELLSGIRSVATGDAVVAPSLTRRLLDTYAHHLPLTETLIREDGLPGPRPGGDPRVRHETGKPVLKFPERRKPRTNRCGVSFKNCSAASYSPTGSPLQ
ncbi:CheY-like chemotaxis protein, partial [Streptomyces sp. LBL]|nr:CheY-like chemotaxis protein [Streptomyces sp. LBL]